MLSVLCNNNTRIMSHIHDLLSVDILIVFYLFMPYLEILVTIMYQVIDRFEEKHKSQD